jgi:hypothetical protein
MLWYVIRRLVLVIPTLVGVDQGVPYSMLVHDYTELALPGDGLTFVDVQNQQDVLTFNAGLLEGFNAVINDIDFIRQHLDQTIRRVITKALEHTGRYLRAGLVAGLVVFISRAIDTIRRRLNLCRGPAISRYGAAWRCVRTDAIYL